ncbi:unnamed protein product, partial [Urochloa humidicola]
SAAERDDPKRWRSASAGDAGHRRGTEEDGGVGTRHGRLCPRRRGEQRARLVQVFRRWRRLPVHERRSHAGSAACALVVPSGLPTTSTVATERGYSWGHEVGSDADEVFSPPVVVSFLLPRSLDDLEVRP